MVESPHGNPTSGDPVSLWFTNYFLYEPPVIPVGFVIWSDAGLV
jgi:hypothetical protein